ncbi:MAG: quinone oxidoreductase family protein [Opitutales bacterium]
MHALCFDRFGGPEVLSWRELPDPAPQPGHAIVRLQAVGLNFADIYRRRGHYHLDGPPPYIAGYEGAGVVATTTEGGPFAAGTRVGFADCPRANAELVSVPFAKLIPLPAGITPEIAAAVLLQGLTAHYLTHDSHPLRPGETAVVHAAAGGVGLLLVQMGRLLGAHVIGLTSGEAKRTAAREAGADHVLLSGDDWPAQVRALTGGRGADVVYDSVGTTLPDSFTATRQGGRVVFYGMAGGDPPPVDPRRLMDASQTLTGGDLWNVLTSAEQRRLRAAGLFDWVASGRVKVRIAKRFPLRDGAAAHSCLESRTVIGKVLLLP